MKFTRRAFWNGTIFPYDPETALFTAFTGQVFFLFLPVFLVILLIPGPLWLKWLFCGVFFLAVILRAMGDWKYRPKKPEES